MILCSATKYHSNFFLFQGALLTHLMHPIYLASITVGSKFHPGHMKRALYERITDHVGPLPSDNYKFNRPQMYATTSPETRQATKVRFNHSGSISVKLMLLSMYSET